MSSKLLQKENVDIGQKAEELSVHTAGTLKRLDDENRINHRWFRARVILLLSAGTIVLILIASLLILALSNETASMDWARQTLTALMGFGAGAIWTSSQARNGEDE